MALPSMLFLNGVGYNTIRGSVTEQKGSGVLWALPRQWTATLDIESVDQEDNLRWCFNGVPVMLITPNNLSVPLVTVTPQDMPAVTRTPRRAFAVQVTITEQL